MPVFKKINKNFFNRWSPEMVYVLGFFAADGNLSINKRGGCYISFQSKDKQIIFDIRKVMKSENKISTRTNLITGSKFYRLQIGSKEIAQILQEIGFGVRKAKHLPTPNIPQKYFPHFVRGYFDGDGNIWTGEIHKERKTKHKTLQLHFTSCSGDFLVNLKDRLKTFHIEGGCVYKSKKKDFSRLQYSTKNALKLYNFMYNSKDSSLYLKRKKEQFNNRIENMRA